MIRIPCRPYVLCDICVIQTLKFQKENFQLLWNESSDKAY